VPWCTSCDRFLSPNTVRADGTCPSCGEPVNAGHAHAPEPHGAEPSSNEDATLSAWGSADDSPVPIPWHLWLLIAALTVYLGYRAFQGLEWVFGF